MRIGIIRRSRSLNCSRSALSRTGVYSASLASAGETESATAARAGAGASRAHAADAARPAASTRCRHSTTLGAESPSPSMVALARKASPPVRVPASSAA